MKKTKRTWDVTLTIVDTLPDVLSSRRLLTKKQIEGDVRYLMRFYNSNGRKLKNVIVSDRAKDTDLTFKGIDTSKLPKRSKATEPLGGRS